MSVFTRIRDLEPDPEPELENHNHKPQPEPDFGLTVKIPSADTRKSLTRVYFLKTLKQWHRQPEHPRLCILLVQQIVAGEKEFQEVPSVSVISNIHPESFCVAMLSNDSRKTSVQSFL